MSGFWAYMGERVVADYRCVFRHVGIGCGVELVDVATTRCKPVYRYRWSEVPWSTEWPVDEISPELVALFLGLPCPVDLQADDELRTVTIPDCPGGEIDSTQELADKVLS